jgi:hypothetical protein
VDDTRDRIETDDSEITVGEGSPLTLSSLQTMMNHPAFSEHELTAVVADVSATEGRVVEITIPDNVTPTGRFVPDQPKPLENRHARRKAAAQNRAAIKRIKRMAMGVRGKNPAAVPVPVPSPTAVESNEPSQTDTTSPNPTNLKEVPA